MKKLASFCFAVVSVMSLRAQCYSVTSTAYLSDTTSSPMSTISMGDDQWSAPLPIGFPFCFYGEQYDSLSIGTNGIITFNLDTANGYCQWPIPTAAVPSPLFPTNAIMGTWCDLSFGTFPQVGIIHWWNDGIAPNRVFVASFDSMLMYQCSNIPYSGRIILHETSNSFEVQIDYKGACSWNQGRGMVGAQNQMANMGIIAPFRGPLTSGWTAQQEGWLFTPDCNVCQGVSVDESRSANDFVVYPNPSTGNFSLQIYGSGIASYDVIDISGRVVLTEKVSGQQTIQFTLENSGMYFIRVYDEANALLKSEKVVLE